MIPPDRIADTIPARPRRYADIAFHVGMIVHGCSTPRARRTADLRALRAAAARGCGRPAFTGQGLAQARAPCSTGFRPGCRPAGPLLKTYYGLRPLHELLESAAPGTSRSTSASSTTSSACGCTSPARRDCSQADLEGLPCRATSGIPRSVSPKIDRLPVSPRPSAGVHDVPRLSRRALRGGQISRSPSSCSPRPPGWLRRCVQPTAPRPRLRPRPPRRSTVATDPKIARALRTTRILVVGSTAATAARSSRRSRPPAPGRAPWSATSPRNMQRRSGRGRATTGSLATLRDPASLDAALKGVTVVINAAATTQLGENDTAAVDREGTRTWSTPRSAPA